MGIIVAVYGISLYELLGSTTGLSGWHAAAQMGTISMLIFHTVVAISATFVLVSMYMEPEPMQLKYRVVGNDSIPMVEAKFVHAGRWTTFTLWCNTLAAVYFWLAALACALMIRDATEEMPRTLGSVLSVLWDITFPMSFLVNLIVTFVLIPGFKRAGDFQKIWFLLKWRGQALHNGYVIVAALEAVLVSPSIAVNSIPIMAMYGAAYVAFAYVVFARKRVFHYFFLDPRFKFAPLAVIGLLVLLIALTCVGGAAIQIAAHSMIAKGCLLLAALATCTFRDSAAVAPETVSSSAHS